MAINVFRRPPVAWSMPSASALCRNEGADVITPKDASAMPLDLMKYLLFIIVHGLSLQFPNYLRSSGQETTKSKVPSPKYILTVVETPVNRRSVRQASPLDCQSSRDSSAPTAVADRRLH